MGRLAYTKIMIDRFLQSLQGNKTYIMSIVGIVATALGLNISQLTPIQAIMLTIAYLIVMALRSAIKTERGIHAAQSADYIVSELATALKKQPVGDKVIGEASPAVDIESILATVRSALEASLPTTH